MWDRAPLLWKVSAAAVTAVLAGAIAYAITGAAPPGGVARAWIDDPRDGSVIPTGQVVVVGHAFDPDGLSELALLIDGTEVGVIASADGILGRAEWTWSFDEQGVHVIEVLGRDRDGRGGVAGRAVIEVADPVALDPGVPPVSTSSTTSASTTTTSSTTTSTTTTSSTTTSTTTTSSTTTSMPATTTAPTTTTTVAAPCAPSAPLLIDPPDGSTFFGPDPEITLSWAQLITIPIGCLASGYRVEIALDPSFTDLRGSEDLAAAVTEWTPPPGTWWCDSGGITHYWRVWAKSSDGTPANVTVAREVSVLCVG